MVKQYKVRACVVYNIGKNRSNHEDNYLLDDGTHIGIEEQQDLSNAENGWFRSIVRIYPETVRTSCVFAVSDGMGGHNAGETASRIAVEQLSAMKGYILNPGDAEGIKKRFQEYIVKANSAITTEASQNPEQKGMGATLTGILLCRDGVMPFNMGDSRTYVFNGEILQRATRDHTEGQRLLDFGLIKEEQMHLIDGGKSITRYLGVDDKFMVPQADIGEAIAVNKRTWFLICSDGLTDMLADSEIKYILSGCYQKTGIDHAAGILIEKALDDRDGMPGGLDNITVLLVEVEVYNPNLFDMVKKKLGGISQSVPGKLLL